MAAAAAMLKRTATISSRSLLTSSSRAYAPVSSRTNLVPAASNLSFSTSPIRDIFKINVGTRIDRWGTSRENSISTVASLCRGPGSCPSQLASTATTFSRRFITTMGNSMESVSHDAPALPSDAPPRLKFKRLDKTARHIMQILDKEAVEQVKRQREIPDIKPGYIVQLKVEVPENKRRVSIIKGIVIARRNAGLNTTFRLRRSTSSRSWC